LDTVNVFVVPLYEIEKVIAPKGAETEPFGLNWSVVAALSVTASGEIGTAAPTFVKVVAGGASLKT
jgi:hypothetical protein